MNGPFLRRPPFPGQRGLPLSRPGHSRFAPEAVLAALRNLGVGGEFWARPASLERGCEVVLVPDDAAQFEAMRRNLREPGITIVLPAGMTAPRGCATLRAPFDPWTVAAQASEVWAGANRELATIAAVLGKPVRIFAGERPARKQPDLIADLLDQLAALDFRSPFDGTPWSIEQAMAQLAEWRDLIEGNRSFRAVYGVARWKRVTLDPLLWDGTGPVRHARTVPADLEPGARVLAWKSRTAPTVLAELKRRGIAISELEDGFIRSVGLGANCVPPLSVIVDNTGIYFDPAGPSDLETMLADGNLPAAWLERAGPLRAALVAAGISKYGQASTPVAREPGPDRRVLVTGQVEDDRSMLSGGSNCSNLELLSRARGIEGTAWIAYKPHPDVEAGHRQGHVPESEVRQHADRIERQAGIAALIDSVDAVHVITSLAGFEALLRGKAVTTHGQPFYAGWGLTQDLAPPVARRGQGRRLDELVAATLIGYPRYLDPVTRLPCPPEVLVQRLAEGTARITSPLVTLRQWQGRIGRWWQRLGGRS